MGFLILVVACCALAVTVAQELQVSVSGDDLYMSTTDGWDCLGADGGHDGDWRVRFAIASSEPPTSSPTWTNWNTYYDDLPSGGGYYGVSEANLIEDEVVPTSQRLYLQLDAWEYDGFFCGNSNDGDCNGYGGTVSTLLTSKQACDDHTVEIIRTCGDPSYQWRAKLSYNYTWKFGNVLKCANEPPTPSPTNTPSKNPTDVPSASPTRDPTTSGPTMLPSATPTEFPSTVPTVSPTESPTTPIPSASPTSSPVVTPEVEESNMVVLAAAGAGGSLVGLALLLFLVRRGGTRAKDAKVLSEKDLIFSEFTKDNGAIAPLTASTAGEVDAPMFVVTHDFVAEEDDELTAAAGTTLMCFEQKGDWYVVRHPVTGETGIIPVSYLKPSDSAL